MAPESLSDDALLELVRKNGKNDTAIRESLAALWNGESYEFYCLIFSKFIYWIEEPAAEWISTEKKKLKKSGSPPLPERGGGGRGRGRSAPPGRGEGGRGGRGGGRSSSVSSRGGRGDTTKTESPSPSPNVEAKVVEEPAVESPVSSDNYVEPPPAPVVQSTKPPISVAPVWGSGMSLAQRIREQELAASAPPPPPPAPPVETTVEEQTPSQEIPVSTEFAGQSKRVSLVPDFPLPCSLWQSPRGADAGRGRGRRRAYQNHPHAPRSEAQAQDASPETEATSEEQAVEELRQELEGVSVAKVEAQVPVQEETEVVEPEVANAASAIPDMSMMSPVRPATNPVTDNIVGSPVLKMGRWGAPIESTDGSSFQFGSFGNLGEAPSSAEADGDESPHKIASGLISSLSEPQTSWGQQPQLDQSDRESEAVSASLSVWGNSQPQNDTPEDSYGYDQQVSNAGNDNAPPGLGLGLGGLDASAVVSQSNSNKSGNNNRSSNRSAPGSQTRKSEMDNNASRQPQQYYQQQQQQPPGIQGGFGGMPYYGFDMNLQPPVTGYGATGQGNSSPVPVPPGNPSPAANAAANVANQNGSYNANANNAPKYPGPPGMPAQMGAPYPPYYGNPYYQQAFYYGGGQPQNFYGRGGQGMYPPRPYGGDPYGPQGMGGYDMYGQPTGQFGDGGVYGQMPMPQMHPQQGGVGNERQTGKGNKNSGGQNAQSAGAVGSAPVTNPGQAGQGDANQALHSGYGMGGYNAYGRPDQGSGWGPYQPGWGGMMPFPAAPTGLGGGYSQMGGAPSQPQGNNRQQGGGSYNSYGRGGGSSGNGAGDPSAGIGSTGTGTTSTW
jgi:hypothetical protein